MWRKEENLGIVGGKDVRERGLSWWKGGREEESRGMEREEEM